MIRRHTPPKTLLETWKKLKKRFKLATILLPIILIILIILFLIGGKSEEPKIEIDNTPQEIENVEEKKVLAENKNKIDTLQNLDFVEIPDLKEVKVNDETFFEEGLVEDSKIDEALFLFDENKVISEKALKFIERFLNTAIVEKYVYDIPICITLAQGIIESNHGESRLAKGYNNFFGIKCKIACKNCDGKGIKKSPDGKCVNFTDDSNDDYFRIFPTPWESFRYRSLLLSENSRYAKLFKIDNNPKTNPHFYIDWSNGLKAAGYATSPKYHKTLKGIIERLNLHKYDEKDIRQLAKEKNIDLKKIDKAVKIKN